mgnify:CR=1 FL=1
MGEAIRRGATGALASLVVALAACESESIIEPGPDTGPLTAYIDGEAFIAETALVDRLQTHIVVTASSGDRSLRFEFPDLGTRNYVIGPGNPVIAEVTIGSSTWRADETTGNGTITVRESIPSYLAGSFDVRLEGSDGSTMALTSGLFVIIG